MVEASEEADTIVIAGSDVTAGGTLLIAESIVLFVDGTEDA